MKNHYFLTILKIKPLTIEYDETFFIKSFVSEQIKKVLDYADKYKKVILTAETGTGKTTGIIKHFHKIKQPKEF